MMATAGSTSSSSFLLGEGEDKRVLSKSIRFVITRPTVAGNSVVVVIVCTSKIIASRSRSSRLMFYSKFIFRKRGKIFNGSSPIDNVVVITITITRSERGE